MKCKLNLIFWTAHVAKWGLKNGPIERWEDVLYFQQLCKSLSQHPKSCYKLTAILRQIKGSCGASHETINFQNSSCTESSCILNVAPPTTTDCQRRLLTSQHPRQDGLLTSQHPQLPLHHNLVFAEEKLNSLRYPTTRALLDATRLSERATAPAHLQTTSVPTHHSFSGPPSSARHATPHHAPPTAVAPAAFAPFEPPPCPADAVEEGGWDSRAAAADPFHADWPYW